MGLVSMLPGMAYRCRNDPDWTMEFVSPGCEELTGYRPDELVGNRVVSYAELIVPEDRDDVWQGVQEAVREERIFQISYRLRTKSGELKWVSEQGRGIFSGNGTLLVLEGYITDITREKSLEAELLQVQKMEAMGQLAGAVAHDFNNVLTAVRGYAEILQSQIDPDDSKYLDVEEILRASEKAASLTSQLLVFTRSATWLEPRVLDVGEQLGEVLGMLRPILRANVHVETSLGDRPVHARADPGQLQQIVTNLVINAQDAMPEGGTLTVRSGIVELDGEAAADVELPPGRYALVEVEDSGTGMEPEVLERAFDVFYTTKPAGKGTGLGLSTVAGIVKDLGGAVSATSELGEGSRFSVHLPWVPEEAADSAAAPEPRVASSRGSETILVAEDDPPLRRLAERALTAAGYRVLNAGTFEEAVAVLDRFEEPIDLLVADTVMPGKPGDELAKPYLERHPAGRVLFISGYLPRDLTPEVRAAMEVGRFLQKPFTLEKLLGKVRRVLDRPASSAPEERWRILVVDDDEQVRDLLEGFLAERGHVVETAADGKEALAAVAEARPDAVLLDLALPDVDGLELLPRLRSEVPGLVVLVISGTGTAEKAGKALELGAVDFISKPVSLPYLERSLLAKLSSDLG